MSYAQRILIFIGGAMAVFGSLFAIGDFIDFWYKFTEGKGSGAWLLGMPVIFIFGAFILGGILMMAAAFLSDEPSGVKS